jgi:hypothetical protein
MRHFLYTALAFTAACSTAPSDATKPDLNERPGETALALNVTDALGSPGLISALPSVTGEAGLIRVQHTRYGSLCRYAVTGEAQVEGSRVAVHITFAEKLSICTEELRALTYIGTLPSAAGSYDVLVIHHEPDTRTDTLVRKTVNVK